MHNSRFVSAVLAGACVLCLWAAATANAAQYHRETTQPRPIISLIAAISTPTRTPTPINLGNFVWNDLDADGVQDAGEPGLAGITVQLWNSLKTQLIASTTTNANGNYTLVAPTPGDYRIRVILAQVLDQFSPLDIGADTADSDINPSGASFGFTNIITIASNVISISSIDAGIIVFRPPTATRTPTPINIGNLVWNDTNANGSKDASEVGLNGITVQLWNSTKTQLIASTSTNLNGNYTVVAPVPGDYRVRVVLPLGAAFAPKNIGSDLTDSDINPTGIDTGFTDIFTIASNVISISSIDAGLISVPATPTLTNTPTHTNTPTTTPTSTLAPTPALTPMIYLPLSRT